MLADFGLWVEDLEAERKPGRPKQRLKDGEAWVPVYDSIDAILDLYDRGERRPLLPYLTTRPEGMDAILASLEDTDPAF